MADRLFIPELVVLPPRPQTHGNEALAYVVTCPKCHADWPFIWVKCLDCDTDLVFQAIQLFMDHPLDGQMSVACSHCMQANFPGSDRCIWCGKYFNEDGTKIENDWIPR
jgi:cytochrome c peroxidase